MIELYRCNIFDTLVYDVFGRIQSYDDAVFFVGDFSFFFL